MSVIERYECPNGHPVKATVAMVCGVHDCRGCVTYEPMAKGIALAEQLAGAVGRIAELEAEVERLRGEYMAGYVDGHRQASTSPLANPGGQ